MHSVVRVGDARLPLHRDSCSRKLLRAGCVSGFLADPFNNA
jgi:hypothetical protein